MKEDDLSKKERIEVLKIINQKLKPGIERTGKEAREVEEKIKEAKIEFEGKVKETKIEFEKKIKEARNEFKKQTSTAIIAAFGILIALAWKDVISNFVNKLNIANEYGLLASAVVITLISVIGILIISRWNKSDEEK